jgi:hypothetical protein
VEHIPDVVEETVVPGEIIIVAVMGAAVGQVVTLAMEALVGGVHVLLLRVQAEVPVAAEEHVLLEVVNMVAAAVV